MIKPIELISPAYRDEQVLLHARPGGYGGKGDKWAPAVLDLVRHFGATSVLDYGCGQGSLKTALQALPIDPAVRIDEYDPGVAGKNGYPEFADLVVTTDVLEHVEPDRLHSVLAHLKLLARKAVFAVIATRPSNKTLSDGRNAHLIVESGDWWEARVLAAGFTIHPEPPVSPSLKVSREWVGVLLP